ncbi:MAG: histidine phosphatase family protein [Candidatus Binatia bacterium]
MVGVHLFLLRHGETTWNQEKRWQGQADVPLSEAGIEQARSLALQLRKEGNPIAAVHSSPLSRALHTAGIIADALGLRPFSDPFWCEMNIGVWSGLTTEEVIARHTKDWERIRAGEDLPRGGGETMAQFHKRVVRGAELLAEKHTGERVAVVTHGGPIRALLLHCRGLPPNRYREVEKIGNASLTEVVFQKGKAIIHRVNDMAHLETMTMTASSVSSPGIT